MIGCNSFILTILFSAAHIVYHQLLRLTDHRCLGMDDMFTCPCVFHNNGNKQIYCIKYITIEKILLERKLTKQNGRHI